MDMDQQLADINRKQDRTCLLLEQLAEKVDGRIEADDRRHERVARTLYGDNGSAGLLIKLDRLEQAHDRQKWTVRTALGAVVVLFVAGIWSLLVA